MNRLLQLLSGKNVAIVGNGNVKEDVSKEIDSADIVVRFNHFYNYDSGKVGKRVDIILQTFTNTWESVGNKHADIIIEQKPNIFVVKKPNLFSDKVYFYLGKDIRIDNIAYLFEHWYKFTTGTCALAYLAQNLTNAKVKCYGFQDEEDWERYMTTDAKKYGYIKDEERRMMMGAIRKLEKLTITSKHEEIPSVIVIPVKANSTGAPNKNRLLIRHCIDVCLTCNLPIHIIGDDEILMVELRNEYKESISTHFVSIESNTSDVTDTVRKWANDVGYCGNIALTLCTSPYLKGWWVTKCVEALMFAPVAATACEINFKPTALYMEKYGVYVPYSKDAPSASVARQLLPHTIRINGAVVAFHTDGLVRKSIWDGGALKPVIVTEEESLDVDTKEDLDKALHVINN